MLLSSSSRLGKARKISLEGKGLCRNRPHRTWRAGGGGGIGGFLGGGLGRFRGGWRFGRAGLLGAGAEGSARHRAAGTRASTPPRRQQTAPPAPHSPKNGGTSGPRAAPCGTACAGGPRALETHPNPQKSTPL
jgi:hypothetical protein